MSEERSVKITGGTFALCLWLFFIMQTLWRVEYKLDRIANALDRAYPIPTAVEEVKK